MQKKSLKSISFVALCLALLFAFTGCAKKTSKFVGQWELAELSAGGLTVSGEMLKEVDFKIDIKDDNTLVFSAKEDMSASMGNLSDVSFTWKEENGELVFDVTNSPAAESVKISPFKIEDEKLVGTMEVLDDDAASSLGLNSVTLKFTKVK